MATDDLLYYRGYPMVVAVSGKMLNEQLARLSAHGLLPTSWVEHPPPESQIAWQVDATLGAPYIDFPEEAERGARLNFPIVSGTVSDWYIGPGHQPTEESHDLAGNVLGIFTPMTLITPDEFSADVLSIKHLYLELDSPHTRTVVRTREDVPTVVVDGATTESFATRFQAYVQEMHPGRLVIGSHMDRAIKGEGISRLGYLEPNRVEYSITPEVDPRYPHGDPRRSERSTINWLLSTADAPPPHDDNLAGQFTHSGLPDDESAVYIISFYTVVRALLLEAVAEALSIGLNDLGALGMQVQFPVTGELGTGQYQFSTDRQKSFQLNSPMGTITSCKITPGDGGSIDATVESSISWEHDYFVYSESGTEQKVSTARFYPEVHDGRLRINVEGSLSWIGGHSEVDVNVSRLRMLGDSQYELHSARFVDGDLVLGLDLRHYEWVEPNAAEYYFLDKARAGAPLEEVREWAKWTSENASWAKQSETLPGDEAGLRSHAIPGEPVYFTLHNNSLSPVRFRWINGNGVPQKLDGQEEPLDVGASTTWSYSVGDLWGVFDAEGRLGGYFRLTGIPAGNRNADVFLKPYLTFSPHQAIPLRPPLGEMTSMEFVNCGPRVLQIYTQPMPDPWSMKLIPPEWWISEPTWTVQPGRTAAVSTFWGATVVVTTEEGDTVAYYQLFFPAAAGQENAISIQIA